MARSVKRDTQFIQGIFLFILLLPATIFAAENNVNKKPLWEFGLGIGGLYIPDYRGSDEQRSLFFPLPYFVYRGDRLIVDRRGARGLVYESGNFYINVSGDLGIPVNSENNAARVGMPDLDLAFHLGPSFDYLIYDRHKSRSTLSFKVPVQLVFTTDFTSLDTQGWYSFPHFKYTRNGNWKLHTTLGVTFATNNFNNYYYGVAPQFATPERPTYNSKGGYGGIRTSIGISKRFKKFWVGTSMRYQFHGGSVYADSPLLKQDYSLGVFVGISWILATSSAKEKKPEH